MGGCIARAQHTILPDRDSLFYLVGYCDYLFLRRERQFNFGQVSMLEVKENS